MAIFVHCDCWLVVQVIGNKWDTYLDLLQADYSEGYGLEPENECSSRISNLPCIPYNCVSYKSLVKRMLMWLNLAETQHSVEITCFLCIAAMPWMLWLWFGTAAGAC